MRRIRLAFRLHQGAKGPSRASGSAADLHWCDLTAKLGSPSIPALDGLRAIAVFLVILYHLPIPGVNGSLGVEMFFVLSGFLITWLLLREERRFGSVSLRAFYTRRVLRIFPAFYCYWLASLAVSLLRGHPVSWPESLSSFFYLENYYKALHPALPSHVSHTWSLAIEEQFYLLWPVLFCLYRKTPARLTTFLASLIALVWVHRTVLHFGLRVPERYIYNAFDTRLDHLMVGCLLAIVLERGLLDSFWRRVCQRLYFPLLTLAALAASSYLSLNHAAYRNVVGFAAEPLLVAVLMVQWIAMSATPAWRFLDWPWVRFLGRISYPLYLYQEMTLFTARRVSAGLPVPVQLAFAVAATVLLASGSYFLVEKPFLRLKDRIEAGRRSSPAPGRVAATAAT